MSEHTIALPASMDIGAARKLLNDISGHRGTPLSLSGQSVERIGGLCLQVLLSAQSAWAAEGKSFAIVTPSAALESGLSLLGASFLLKAGDLP